MLLFIKNSLKVPNCSILTANIMLLLSSNWAQCFNHVSTLAQTKNTKHNEVLTWHLLSLTSILPSVSALSGVINQNFSRGLNNNRYCQDPWEKNVNLWLTSGTSTSSVADRRQRERATTAWRQEENSIIQGLWQRKIVYWQYRDDRTDFAVGKNQQNKDDDI